MTTTDETANLWYYKLGTYYGMLFKLIFYTEKEGDPVDPALDLVWTSGFGVGDNSRERIQEKYGYIPPTESEPSE